MQKITNNNGQSILEVILALGIFSLIAVSMMALATGGFTSLIQGGEQTEAEALAQEAIEGVRSIRDGAWNDLVYTTSSIGITGNQWVFSGENTTQVIGKYTRTISFDNVCRNASNNITACPGSYTDIQSKKMTVSVSWNTSKGAQNQVEQIAYLTNWDSREWTQTDWSGGSGQPIWSDATRYDTDDGNIDSSAIGQVSLAPTVSTSFSSSTWPFDMPSDYTYNATQIQVASGLASLVDQGTGNFCSGIINACNTFLSQPICISQTGCSWGGGSSGSSPAWSTTWGTYADWEGSSNVSGSSPTTGGNPTNYKNITITRNSGAQTSSGYWQQSFTTTASNPETATLNFDWKITSFNGSKLTSYIIYVFVDNTAGAPVIGNQVWSQQITGITGWVSVTNLNVASKLTASGTYYIKLVARRIKPFGNPPNVSNVVGFDNVSLNWFKSGACSGTHNACTTYNSQPNCISQNSCTWSLSASYPTNSQTVNPVSGFVTSTINMWTGFSEIANKNGGEIYYQLSDDSGGAWKFWNGSAWAISTLATDYNLASVVSSNIRTFSTSTAQIMFKAFLKSNGSQLVQLDAVEIGYTDATASGNYTTSAYFVSSAFNTGISSPSVQVLEWNETQPVGSDIKLQIRTAPDSGGSPGVWTSWYGATGVGTYFINPLGSIIPVVLNGNKWLQYRAEMTGDGLVAPILQEVRVNYK